MRIFCSFWNNITLGQDSPELPLYYEGLLKGLLDSGNHVLYHCTPFWYKEQTPHVPLQLLSSLQKFDPELIILFNNVFYDIDLSREFSCPVLVWEVDSPIYYSNKGFLKNNHEVFYAVAASETVDVVMNMFGAERRQIIHIPFFTSIRNEPKEKNINISFIGTRFYSNDMMRLFQASNPSEEDRRQFDAALNYVLSHPFGNMNELIAACGTTSLAVMESFEYDKACSLLSAARRTETLGAVADLGLHLYGSPTWIDLEHPVRLALAYRNTPVYSIKHNQDIYNASKISISVSHIQATSGFPWRVVDIMASSSCLVSDYHSDFRKFFPNAPIPCFNSPFEAREICQRLLKNEAERNDIVAACNEQISDNFRVQHILDLIGDFIGLRLYNEQYGIATLPATVRQVYPRTLTATKSFRGERRLKLTLFCVLLATAQLPLLNHCFSSKRRSWLLERIRMNFI